MRVLVVSSNRLAQAGLGAIVEQAEGLEVVAALSPEEAVDAVARLGAEAGLIDAETGEAPELHLAVLADSAQTTTDAVAAGAAVVLPADITPAALGAALSAASYGLAVLGRDLAAGLIPPEATQPLERLTPREVEVL